MPLTKTAAVKMQAIWTKVPSSTGVKCCTIK